MPKTSRTSLPFATLPPSIPTLRPPATPQPCFFAPRSFSLGPFDDSHFLGGFGLLRHRRLQRNYRGVERGWLSSSGRAAAYFSAHSWGDPLLDRALLPRDIYQHPRWRHNLAGFPVAKPGRSHPVPFSPRKHSFSVLVLPTPPLARFLSLFLRRPTGPRRPRFLSSRTRARLTDTNGLAPRLPPPLLLPLLPLFTSASIPAVSFETDPAECNAKTFHGNSLREVPPRARRSGCDS